MTFSINQVFVAGRVGDYGVKLTYLPSGKPELTFSLRPDKPMGEEVYKTYIPIQVYGAQAEALAESIEPGDVVLLDGKLTSRADKTEESATLVVTCYRVEVLVQATTPA